VSAVTSPDRRAAAAAIDAFLRAIGRDVSAEPELAGTGARVAEMFVDELCAGYAVDTRALVARNVLDAGSGPTPALVVVRDIPVATTCPHHLLTSLGTATVAFAARSRLVGLGAVAALVDAHARRLTLQERIGEDVIADLDAALAPAWVGCRLVLRHGCMLARGERAHGTSVETVALRCPPDQEVAARLALGAA
jgi:GTP cyclohydrolase I